MRRPIVLAACAALAGCGGGGDGGSTATIPQKAAKAPARTASGCERVAAPTPKGVQKLPKPTGGRLDPAKTWTATLETSCGTFAVRLAVRAAPKTSASFASLARRGLFDGLTFHRIVPGFVIQGGDPRGNGTGGPGYTVVEPPSARERYPAGTVAMAKTATEPAGASGSQFFVVTAEDASASAGLTPDYAVLGRVVRGMGVVRRIEGVPASQDGTPREPVVIRRVTVSGR